MIAHYTADLKADTGVCLYCQLSAIFREKFLDLLSIVIIAPPILLALTIHEYAHGYVAYRLGDDTAYLAGRLTLNPLSHLDPIGTLMLFIAHIGWAKPVPVNPYNLRNPKRDLIWVSIAGPAANMILALAGGIVIRLLPQQWFIYHHSTAIDIMLTMLVYLVVINIILAVFNLIPIPPLDGSKILGGLLTGQAYMEFRKFERYGPVLFIILIAGGYLLNIPILWWIISPFVRFFSLVFAGVDLSGF